MYHIRYHGSILFTIYCPTGLTSYHGGVYMATETKTDWFTVSSSQLNPKKIGDLSKPRFLNQRITLCVTDSQNTLHDLGVSRLNIRQTADYYSLVVMAQEMTLSTPPMHQQDVHLKRIKSSWLTLFISVIHVKNALSKQFWTRALQAI